MSTLITTRTIEQTIHLIRGHRVLVDDDLAQLYGVPTKRLNEQVRRNAARFPDDFMFQLTPSEAAAMRSQNATASRRNVRHLPRAFTEQGVAMLASVLNSARAVAVNIEIVRVFVRLRQAPMTSTEVSKRLAELETSVAKQHSVNAENAKHFRIVFDVLRKLMSDEQPNRDPIGFKTS